MHTADTCVTFMSFCRWADMLSAVLHGFESKRLSENTPCGHTQNLVDDWVLDDCAGRLDSSACRSQMGT
jgi:hypothetical protein